MVFDCMYICDSLYLYTCANLYRKLWDSRVGHKEAKASVTMEKVRTVFAIHGNPHNTSNHHMQQSHTVTTVPCHKQLA